MATEKRLSRRNFLKTAAACGAAFATSARSYARISGANDRIAIGQIGCGSRGLGTLMAKVQQLSESQNVEIIAAADPWRIARENAGSKIKSWYAVEPRVFSSARALLDLKEIDAVIIASCDHHHAAHLQWSAEAGKDVYIEKPLAKDFDPLKAACDAAEKANLVVQIGTQLRSSPAFAGCKKLFETGVLGTVSRVEQCRNEPEPYWLHYINKEVRKEDLDWAEFTMGRTERAFDPVFYSGWMAYREFSDGPVTQFGSHFIDLVHYITGAKFPISCVCHGGTFVWKDEHQFSCPDQVQALWVYPEGFLVSYSTNFGNSGSNSFRIFGDVGQLDMTNWHLPVLTAEGGIKNKGAVRGKTPVEETTVPDHMLDWLQCLRSRKACIAPLSAGYQHTVACLMAVQAFDNGRRMVYDPAGRVIRPG